MAENDSKTTEIILISSNGLEFANIAKENLLKNGATLEITLQPLKNGEKNLLPNSSLANITFKLTKNQNVKTIGRKDFVNLEEEKRISRNHLKFELLGDSPALHQIFVQQEGVNPSTLYQCDTAKSIVLSKGTKIQVNNGDVLYLIPKALPYRVLLNPQMEEEKKTSNAANSKKRISKEESEDENEIEIIHSFPNKKPKYNDKRKKADILHELYEMFPQIDKEFVQTVLQASELDANLAIEYLVQHSQENNFSPQVFYLNKIPGLKKGNDGTLDIRSLFQKDLKHALLTSYDLDLEWLLNKIPNLQLVPVVIVHDLSMLPENIPKNVQMIRPKLPLTYGCHHGKIMVLEYPSFLRVVVSTANLIYKDYERKTNGIWFQDFLPKSLKTSCPITCDFQETLFDYLKRVGVDTNRYEAYDFSTATVSLITSVPGYHTGNFISKYGHMKIRNILKNQIFQEEFNNNPTILCQFSSVGSLSEKWVHDELLVSFVSQKQPKIFGQKASIQLVWPTVDFVQHCIDGFAAGSSLCFPEKNLKDFMKPLMYKYEGQEGKEHIPPHIKCFCRISKGGNHVPWICLSSANMSKAAWGEFQKNGSQLVIRNYEVGVLFIAPRQKETSEYNGFILGKTPQITSTQTVFPIPYSFPPQKYSFNERPWTWGEFK